MKNIDLLLNPMTEEEEKRFLGETREEDSNTTPPQNVEMNNPRRKQNQIYQEKEITFESGDGKKIKLLDVVHYISFFHYFTLFTIFLLQGNSILQIKKKRIEVPQIAGMDTSVNNKFNLLTDITHLLKYPQRVAAAKLGMTESMLSKKYKEATDRKWPFRYVKRLEKEIEVTQDLDRVKKLEKQKQKHLSSVFIFVKRTPTSEDSKIVLEIDKD